MRFDANHQINTAIKTYLGTGEKGGYSPYGSKERMKQEFGKASEPLCEEVEKYIQFIFETFPAFPFEDLDEARGKIKIELEKSKPELDAASIDGLCCLYAYSWK